MIGSFLTRSLALALGYAYPAYECFKTVELNRPEIEKLRFWCQYWILVAALTVFERVGDTFISWLPMYSEAKVAFFVYLWYPKTRGATYVYETFFQPYVASHETEIDRNLLELKARAGDIVFLYWQKAASYGQTRVFEIFQYIASQSTRQQSRSRSTMQRQPVQNNCQTQALASPACQAATAQQPKQPKQPSRAPPSPTKNKNQGPAKDAGDPRAVPISQTHLSSSTPTLPAAQQPSRAPPSPTKNKNQGPAKDAGDPRAVPTSQTQLSSSSPALLAASASTSQPSTIEGEEKQIAATTIATNAIAAIVNSNPPPQESLMEEAIPMTRGRLRKRAASSGPSTH